MLVKIRTKYRDINRWPRYSLKGSEFRVKLGGTAYFSP